MAGARARRVDWVRVARADEIPDGGFRTAFVSGTPVAVRRVRGEWFAIQNVCPHRGGPLGEGDLEGYSITCPMHAWTFDLRSGQHVANPVVRVKTFPVRVVDGWVEVGPAGAAREPAPAPPPAPREEKRGFWRFGRT